MNEPEAPEHKEAVDAHFGWWRAIWAAQAERGADVVWAEPEFGPPPYLQTLPHTNAPVADLWDINSRIGERVRVEHAKALAEHSAAGVAAEAAAAEAAAAAAGAPKPRTKKFVPVGGGADGVRFMEVDVEEAGDKSTSALGAAMLELATKDPKEVAREERAAREANAAHAKLRQAALAEGGQKGAEMAGAAAATGLRFFSTPIEAADGDLPLLGSALQAMNAPPSAAPADAAGGSAGGSVGGSVDCGKMLFSAGKADEQLAIVAYVPSGGDGKVDVTAWTQAVLEAIGGKVMLGSAKIVTNGTETGRGLKVEAAVAADPANGKTPKADLDVGLAAAFTYLKEHGAIPVDVE